MGISFKPSETVTGGLVQDIDVRITKARYTVFDYDGKASKPALAVLIEMEPVDGGDAIKQYYSAGSLDRFAPSEDNENPLTEVGDEGRYVVAAENSTATSLSRSSNFIFFIQELASAGFPEERMGDDVSSLEGSVIHVIRKPAPKREGLGAEPVAGAREKTILVASKVLQYPWDKKANSKGKAATAAAGAKGGNDVVSLTASVIKDVLAKNGGTITPSDAKKNAFPALIKNKSISTADRNTILANLMDVEWLGNNQGPETGFGFDGDNIISV